jgi:hypothetical protein
MKSICFLVVLVALVASHASVSLAGWSVKNPYRTYNLTGLNYGAQNWEQQYGNQRRASQPVRARWLRRR